MSSFAARARAFLIRLSRSVRRRRSASDFDEELAAHVAIHTEAGVAAGLSEAEARRQALMKLGGAEQVRQAQRERAGLLWIENLLQDVRYGARTLRRAPGFATTAIATVGLGIGACTAIFSLVNAVLIRSLPYGDPERLVYLFTPNPNFKIPAEVLCPGYGDYFDIRRENKSFESMSNLVQKKFSVDEHGSIQRIGSARVDEDFFHTLQAQPELGRAIGAEDVQAGHEKVAVISHSLWVLMFGARAGVLEKSLTLDHASYRIVGVMPPEFEYPFGSDLTYGDSQIKSTQIWVPLVLDAAKRAEREPDDNVTIARLRSGVTLRAAQAEMSAMMARLDKEYPGDPKSELGTMRAQWGALVKKFTDISLGPVRPLMRLLLAAVGLVLLIACGNAANLLLARAAERARELGVRVALGAGQARMVRQLLTESMLIGAAGCAMGVGLAYLFLRVLPVLDPENIPRLNRASLDWRVLLVAVGAALFTSLAAGLLPAWLASRMELTEFLKAQGARAGTRGHSRVQSALIVAQTAMVVVLLAAAGLLIRSYIKVISVDTGFSRATVTFHLALDDRYKPQQMGAFYRDLISKLQALPGVQAVGAVNDLPLNNSETVGVAFVDGSANKDLQFAETRSVTLGYFAAMNIPLIKGRYFQPPDVERRSAIINETFAKTYFANRNPIGGHTSGDPRAKPEQWGTIVGIVADVRHVNLEDTPQPQIYNPGFDGDNASIAVRTSIPPAAVASEIRTTLKAIDPQLAITDIRTMGDLVSMASARRRFQASLLTAFAAIALVLALVGLYGLMAFSVNRRTREVGIRMALGAERRDVLLLILRNAGALVGAGLIAGLASVWMVTRVMRSFLFGVSAHDPLTVTAVCVLMIVCGMLAALVPARRAASIEPMQALRTE
jgi:predicted permease